MTIEKFDEKKCTGCGACVEYCTRDVWRMNPKTGKAYVAYKEDCQACYTCEINCPESAIWVHPFRYAPKMWPCDMEYKDNF